MTLYRLEVVLVNPDTDRTVFRGHAGIEADDDCAALEKSARCFADGNLLGIVLGDALHLERVRAR